MSPGMLCVTHTGLVHRAVDRQVLGRLEREMNTEQSYGVPCQSVQSYAPNAGGAMLIRTGHSYAPKCQAVPCP